MLSAGEAWLDSQRHEHMTDTVVYVRGAASVSLQATRGRTEFRQVGTSGVQTRVVSVDFIIRTADLVLAGELTKPVRGDRISQTLDGFSETYEVITPGGEPVWRWCDAQGHLSLRIHTKLAGRVAA